MIADNLNIFIPTLVLMSLGVIAVFASLIIGRFIRPKNPTALKLSPYECGETPVGSAWSAFNMRFYVVGLVFIIFDVESALMFPVAAVFKQMNDIGRGGLVLAEVLIFLSVLIAGIAYCWRKGDLDWVKSFQQSKKGQS